MIRILEAFDGSWWEAMHPEGWLQEKDISIKNWPHSFQSPSGSRLLIYWTKNAWFDAGAFGSMAPDDLTKAQQVAYQFAACAAERIGSKVSCQEIGSMSIYFYSTSNENQKGWEGFISKDPYMLRVDFDSPHSSYGLDTDSAWAILHSLKLHEPNE